MIGIGGWPPAWCVDWVQNNSDEEACSRLTFCYALKGVAYDAVWIDLHQGENLTESFERVSPVNQVPCLEIGGQRLFQSSAIVEYLEETRPEPALLPEDALERAEVRGITEIINSVIQPLHNLAVRNRLMEQFNASGSAVQAWCRYWIERRFAGLNRALEASRGRYSKGDSVTVADVFLYPQVKTSRRFGVDTSGLPAITAVMKALGELDAFRGSHPPEN